MSHTLIPVPEFYKWIGKKNKELGIDYIKRYLKHNYPGYEFERFDKGKVVIVLKRG